MKPEEIKNLERFAKVYNAFGDTIPREEIIKGFELFAQIIKNHVGNVDNKVSDLEKTIESFRKNTDAEASQFTAMVLEKVELIRTELQKKITSIQNDKAGRGNAPDLSGKKADEQAIFERLLAAIPIQKIPVEMTPDQTIEKINKAETKISADRVEGLDRLPDIERIAKANAAVTSLPSTTNFFNGVRAKNLAIQGTSTSQSGDTANVIIETLTNTTVVVTAPATTSTGYLGVPQNFQNKGYSFVLTDSGQHVYHPPATSAHTWTIPANASIAFPIGTQIIIVNDTGAGVITLTITSDTLQWQASTGSRSIAANGVATILKITATSWVLTGTGIS